MKILLTNDDGIHSKGLMALKDALVGHEVWIVAPDRERSASSQSITIKDPVRYHKLEDRVFTCSGTPADCVLFSMQGAIDSTPDVILSGINYGANLGIDLLYSGTAAAARQGALLGIPSIALSQCSFTPPFYFEKSASFISENLEQMVELWHPDHFININVPNIEDRKLEARITVPSRSRYIDKITSFKAPNGDIMYMMDGERGGEGDETLDSGAVAAGYISISPVFLYPMNHDEEIVYKKAEFKSV